MDASEVKRANLNSYYFKKAFARDSKVVYVNSLMPSEIFLAMDLIPFNLGLIGGILAQGKASTKFITTAQQNHFPNDLCSTSHCILGAAFNNALPTPDFLVIASIPCDVGSNIYYFLSQFYERKWFMLDVPYCFDNWSESVSYLEEQIKKLVLVLENQLNIKLDQGKLKRHIVYSNEAARFIQESSELGKRIPSPLSAAASIEIASSFHLLGSKEMAEICKRSYEEINKKASETVAPGKRKPRILWHGMRPFYTDEIFQYLENNCGVEIISEINVHGNSAFNWGILDPDNPYQSLAEKMIRMTGSNFFNQQTLELISTQMKDYTIDGVIAFNSRGCRHMLSIHQVLRDTATKNNLAYLEIDGDYIDDRDYSFQQIKTRLDAFVELLYGRNL